MATVANPKQEAHELIERLSTGQVIAAIGLFKAMLDPVSVALASAPIDDEPVSEEEAHDIAEARAAASSAANSSSLTFVPMDFVRSGAFIAHRRMD